LRSADPNVARDNPMGRGFTIDPAGARPIARSVAEEALVADFLVAVGFRGWGRPVGVSAGVS